MEKRIDNSNYKNHLNSNVLRIFLALTFIFFILILPPVSAAEIQFQNPQNTDVFDSGETLLAVISGNFFDQPTEDNVAFYRDHVPTSVVFEMEKIGDEFYLYALLTGKLGGNYSINISGIRYYLGTRIVDEPFNKTFAITSGTADFSLKPGFVTVNAGETLSLEVQNLKTSQINIDVETSSGLETQNTNVNLLSGQVKQIGFLLNNPQTQETITLSSGNTIYEIPVFVSETAEQQPEQEKSLEFQPSTVSVSLATDSETKRILYLKNTGEATLNNIEFFISPVLESYITIEPNVIDELDANETIKVEMQIASDIEEAIIEGTIRATSASEENVSGTLTFVLNFIQDYIPPEGTDTEEIIVSTCGDLKGSICSEGQECSGESVNAKNGVCCLTQCRQIEKSSSGRIIGWALVVLILIILFWFFRRYKRVRPKIPFGLKK